MKIINTTNKSKIRVMADYGSSGFWNESGMVVLNKTQITESLEKDVKKWIDWYRKQLDWSNPDAGCIFYELEKNQFLKLELDVFSKIKFELGDLFDIEFIHTTFV